MADLGLNAYRFSVAWTRVLPEGRGRVNQPGLDFYSRLVDSLLELDIVPFVTLYHWDLPQMLQDQGGWPARSTAEVFVEYADAVTRALGDRVSHWVTHNEPRVIVWEGYLNGVHAPGQGDPLGAVRASHHVLLSHGWALPIIRRNVVNPQVGITLDVNWTQPASNARPDRDQARLIDGQGVRWFSDPLYGRGYPADVISHFVSKGYFQEMEWILPGDMEAISEPTDFLGVNYYNRSVVRGAGSAGEPALATPPSHTFGASDTAGNGRWTAMGWEVYPQGLFQVLMRLFVEYQPPRLYVTENGASYEDFPSPDGRVNDEQRTRYLMGHFEAAQRAIQMGVPLEGYFVWSLLDNFEWAHGYSQRFGIVRVDFETQQRVPKTSALWLRDVIKQNRS
jgi:beta-glucosidase